MPIDNPAPDGRSFRHSRKAAAQCRHSVASGRLRSRRPNSCACRPRARCLRRSGDTGLFSTGKSGRGHKGTRHLISHLPARNCTQSRLLCLAPLSARPTLRRFSPQQRRRPDLNINRPRVTNASPATSPRGTKIAPTRRGPAHAATSPEEHRRRVLIALEAVSTGPWTGRFVLRP